MNKIPQLSVFFPAYNEEANIKSTVEKAVTELDKIADRYEILVVNDGSTDNTEAIVRELIKKNPNIRLISHKENLGYGAALRTGFYGANYDPIVFTDADGQFDFSEVENLLAYVNEAALIVGYRIKRMDPTMRKLNAWGWKMLIRLFFRLNVKDVDCAFKLIKKSVLEKIPPLESTRGGMISPELMIKADRAGIAFVQVGVHHYPRKAGSPTGASIQVIIISLFELIKLWWKISILKPTSPKKAVSS